MIELYPHQAQLLRELDPENRSPRTVVRWPTGSGLSRALTTWISMNHEARVLVFVSSLASGTQWIRRLTAAAQQRPVRSLRTAADALEMLERGDAPSDEVVVTWVKSLSHDLFQKALLIKSFDVLVVDDPPRNFSSDANFIAVSTNAAQVVALSGDGGGRPTDWPGFRVAAAQPSRQGVERLSVHYRLGLDEIDLLRDVREFIRENPYKQWSMVSTTRATLHQRLLRIASAAEGDAKGVEDRAWTYIDRIEQLGPDPRLAALEQALNARPLDRTAIQISGALVETEYVGSHLSTALTPRAVVTLSGGGVHQSSDPDAHVAVGGPLDLTALTETRSIWFDGVVLWDDPHATAAVSTRWVARMQQGG